MQRKRTMLLLKDTAWFAIGNFGSKLLSILLVPLYTSVLSTNEFGSADIITTTVNLLVPFLTLTIQEAAFRFAMDDATEQNKVLSNCLVVTVAAPFLLLFLSPLLRSVLPIINTYWWYFFVIFVAHSLSNVLSNYLKAVGKSNIFAIQGIIYTFVFATTNIVSLVVMKKGLPGYLFSFALAYAVSCIFMVFSGKIYRCASIHKIDRMLLHRMLKYCVPLIPAAISWWIMSSIDKYMLLYMCGTEANGLYSVANKVPTIITTLTTFFVNSWQITAIRNREDSDISEYSSKIFNVSAIIGLLLTLGIVLISQPTGYLLFAKEFYVGWSMSGTLAVSAFFSALSQLLGAQFTANKRSDIHLKSNLIAMVTNVIFSYLLISIFGVNGAAYGTMLSYLLILLYRSKKVLELMRFEFDRRIYVGFALTIVAAFATGFAFRGYYLISGTCLIICCLLFHKEYFLLIRQCTRVVHNKLFRNNNERNEV